MGTVIQESRTSNIARECSLAAGIPNSVPSFTVTLACISSNVAMATGVDLIQTGKSDIVIASGTETMSDVPIRFSKPIRARMLASRKVKGAMGYLGLLKGLKLGNLAPELPAIAEFSTGEIMGHSADRLAAMFSVSRLEQDQFALRSHLNAAKALSDGTLKQEIFPTRVPPSMKVIEVDNGVRGDSTEEKMAKLKAAFVKPHGTVTAANSSFTTDGASATLLMSEKKALELGYQPKAYFFDTMFTSQDPKDELLLGPAYATARLLQKHNLKLKDISVFEFHEAFAAQILANLRALESTKFCTERAKVKEVVGTIPMDKFNIHGGSLSLGHPFGATGCRLATTAAHRLERENGDFALIAACAAGGQAVATLLRRYKKQ
jgi:acetyl-CoA acyltransferase